MPNLPPWYNPWSANPNMMVGGAGMHWNFPSVNSGMAPSGAPSGFLTAPIVQDFLSSRFRTGNTDISKDWVGFDGYRPEDFPMATAFGLFGQLMEGEEGYRNYLKREGQNNPGPAQPGFFGFKSGGWISRAIRRMSRGGLIKYQLGGPVRHFEFGGDVEQTLSPKGDPWEYKKSGGKYLTRKKGSDRWITLTSSMNQGKALPAVMNLFGDSVQAEPTVQQITRSFEVSDSSGKLPSKTKAKPGDYIPRSYEVSDSLGNTNTRGSQSQAQKSYNMTGQGLFKRDTQEFLPDYMYDLGPRYNQDTPPVFTPPADIQGSGLGVGSTPGASWYQDPMVQSLIGYTALGLGIPGIASAFSPSGSAAGIARATRLIQSMGRPAQSPLNPYTAMFQRYGGPVHYQMGGSVEIQTEKGEVLRFPDMGLYPVKAKVSHKKMDSDKVTDLVPQETYVFSDDKKLTLKPDEKIFGVKLKDFVIGKTAVKYSETESYPGPEEIKFSEVLTSKMTAAKVAKKIAAKFPMTSLDKDPFAKLAQEENKKSRAPYLTLLTAISEIKRPKKPEEFKHGGLTQLYDDKTLYGMSQMDNVMKRDNALLKSPLLPGVMMSTSPKKGITSSFFPFMRYGGVPRFGGGGDPFSMILGQILGPAVDLGFGIADRARIKKLYKQTLEDIGIYDTEAQGNIDQASQIGTFGTLANFALNDPRYAYLNPQPSMSSASNAYGQVQRNIRADQQSAQQLPLAQANSFLRYAPGSGLSPTQMGNMASNIYAQGIGASNQAGLQYNSAYNQSILGGDSVNRGYLDLLARDRQQGQNYMIGANNQLNTGLVQGLAGNQISRLQSSNDLMGQTLAAKMGARGQQANFLTQSGIRLSDSLSNLGYGLMNALRPPYDPYGTNLNYGYGNAQGYSTPWGPPQMNNPYSWPAAQQVPPYMTPGMGVDRSGGMTFWNPWAFPN